MIVVAGGTGFVGKELCVQLKVAGYAVRALSRKASLHKVWASRHGIELHEGDAGNPASLADALQGAKGVINLVGILTETRSVSYEMAHLDATRNLVVAAQNAGVRRFLQMSSLNTRLNAPSRYFQTKAAGEAIVKESGLDWTILRPSLIYGEGDLFSNLFATLMKYPWDLLNLWSVPCLGDGTTVYRPSCVDEVATAFVRSLSNPQTVGESIDLCGPEITMRGLLEDTARALGMNPTFLNEDPDLLFFQLPWAAIRKPRPILYPVPITALRLAAWVLDWLYWQSPKWVAQTGEFVAGQVLAAPRLTQDMVLMLAENQTGDCGKAKALLGYQPRPYREGIASYIKA